ncbi:NfeD family protein [Bremerella cremea]|uniref:NfeD family protein n=1 Tax=Bremerella cremea TaxID=1031537 RepID=UPI0031E6BA9C
MLRARGTWIWRAEAILLAILAFLYPSVGLSQQDGAPAAGEVQANEAAPKLTGVRLRVPLPIKGTVDTDVKQSLQKLLSRLTDKDPRPVVILELEGKPNGQTRGSEFERSLALARFLTSKEATRLKTVAFLKGPIEGHAVLIPLACEQIVMHPDAQLGNAGVDEPIISDTMRRAYQEIAGFRGVLPPELALGMLDPALEIYRVNGRRFVDGTEYARMKADGEVATSDKLNAQGQLLLLTANQLRQDLQLISHVTEDTRQLATLLGIPENQLTQDIALDREWKAAQFRMDGEISNRMVQRTALSIQDAVSQGTNFVLIDLKSPGGDPVACENMINFLLGLPDSVHTVALITDEATSNASLIAMACDEIAIAPNASLGGTGSYAYTDQGRRDLEKYLAKISPEAGRSWSVWGAMNDPNLEVFRYQRPGTTLTKYLSVAEAEKLPNADQWQQGELITQAGVPLQLTGKQALDWSIADSDASSITDITRRYGLPDELEEPKQNWAHQFVEILASPSLAFFCLFIGVIAMISEFKAPGIGVPGFVAALCFGLFFWSRFLNGTAGWLEAMLFVGGIVFILMEVLVLPGFGIFGLGGGLMVITAVVLAMQTFIWPTTDYELEQVPYSLASILVLFSAFIAALVFAKHILPRTPYLNESILEAPDEETMEEIRRRETIVDLTHLIGTTGQAVTMLRPGGKAKIGHEIVNVTSDGDVIQPGDKVEVVEVRGNYAIVRRKT